MSCRVELQLKEQFFPDGSQIPRKPPFDNDTRPGLHGAGGDGMSAQESERVVSFGDSWG